MLAVLALYLKNLAVFGFFGTSTFLPFNMAHATTKQLSPEERNAWVAEHRIHPAAVVSIFAGPEAYAPWVDLSQKRGVPVLDELERAPGVPNYNHWSYLRIFELRQAAVRYYIAQHPGRYLATVAQSSLKLFGPTSHWHPDDEKKGPHVANRRVIGGWERVYDAVLHGFPRPVGVYYLLVALAAFATWRALRTFVRERSRAPGAPLAALFMAFTCAWVVVLSCLVTTTELARYRFGIEALLWVLAAQAFVRRGAVATPAPPSPSPAPSSRPAAGS